MKLLLGFLLCLFVISCAPTPEAGQTYQNRSTGQNIKVEFVGKMAEVNQFIADDKSRLTYPGRTPNFGSEMSGGTPDSGDVCVLYKVVTPAPDPALPPSITYFIYKDIVFTKAFTKVAE